MNIPIIKGEMEIKGVEQAINNANELIDKLKEAQTLADELSDKVSNLDFKLFVNERREDCET